jgi:hypothetical protein
MFVKIRIGITYYFSLHGCDDDRDDVGWVSPKGIKMKRA